jgi:hypothetical protein
MSKNTKNQLSTSEKLTDLAQQAGVLLMAGAITVGMIEMPDHPNNKVILPNQPAMAVVGGNNGGDNNPVQREREETAPHFISYSVVQRTASRAGRT